MGMLDRVVPANKDERFVELIKGIRGSKLTKEQKDNFVDYLTAIRRGNRVNDFYDDEFLERVILEILSFEGSNNAATKWDYFKSLTVKSREMFVLGNQTTNYNVLKQLFINSVSTGGPLTTNAVYMILYTAFDDKTEAYEIANIIKNSNYPQEIFDYAIKVAPLCPGQDSILKKDIVSYAYGLEKVQDIEEYTNECIKRAQKRLGIYDIDLKTVARIDARCDRLERLDHKFDNIEERINRHDERIKALIEEHTNEINKVGKESVESLKKIVGELRQEIELQLSEEVKIITQNIRLECDKVFNQMLIDKAKEISSMRIEIQSLDTTTFEEIARIRNEADKIMGEIHEYVNNAPKIQTVLGDSRDGKKLLELLNSVGSGKIVINTKEEADGKEEAKTTTPQVTKEVIHEKTISIPGFYVPEGRIIAPESDKVHFKKSIDYKVLPVLDSTVDINIRLAEVQKLMEEKEKAGVKYNEKFMSIIKYMLYGRWVYIWGPTGCGKSYMLNQIADLLGLKCVKSENITQAEHVLGYNDPFGKFRVTPTASAVAYGDMLGLDEYDANNTDVLIAYNNIYSSSTAVVDDPTKVEYFRFGEDAFVRIHPNFRMISCGNTDGSGENSIYCGRLPIDESIKNRWKALEINYSEVIESSILTNKEWYEFCKRFRLACKEYAMKHKKDAVSGTITTDDISFLAKSIKDNIFTVDELLEGDFIHVKNYEYLNFISEYLRATKGNYGLSDNLPKKSLDKYTANELTERLVYLCDQFKENRRRKK